MDWSGPAGGVHQRCGWEWLVLVGGDCHLRASEIPEDTQFSTKNAQLQPEETQPHGRSEQMHDLQTRSSG